MKAKQSKGSKGFSLIELLVVLAIGAIVATLSVQTYLQVIKSSVLTGAAQSITATLDEARQVAITRNEDVEVRLYQLPSANNTTGTPTSYRALQTFLISDSGSATPITKVVFLPSPIIMQASNPGTSDHSPLLSGSDPNMSNQSGSTLNQPLPVFQNNYNSMAFRFTPKGALNVSGSQQWFVTLVASTDPLEGNNFPSNYATVQIDPYTGRTRFFRP